MKEVKTVLIHDNFQNYKRYGIPRAQLVIADIPYNIGKNAYGSNPMWYEGGILRNKRSLNSYGICKRKEKLVLYQTGLVPVRGD